MDAKVVSFTAPLTGGGTTLPVTGVGFKPQAIIFFSSGDTGSSSIVSKSTQQTMIGVVDKNLAQFTAASLCVDGVDPTNGASAITSRTGLNAITVFNTGSGRDELKVISMDPDGFTVEVMDTFSAAYRIFALCIAGVENVKAGLVQMAGSTGNLAYTGTGFQPDVLFFFGAMGTNAPPVTAGGARIWVGAAKDSTHQGMVMSMGARANGTNARRRYANSGECVGNLDDVTNNMNTRASLVSMDSDGFTLNFLEVAATKYFAYLAIKGGTWTVGNFVSHTDTTAYTVATTFTPRAIFLFSDGAAEDTADTTRTQAKLSIGAFSGGSTFSRGTAAHFDLDGVNPTQVSKGMRVNDAVYERISDAGTVDDGVLDITAVSSTDFTVQHTDADPDQAIIFFLAGGESGQIMTNGTEQTLWDVTGDKFYGGELFTHDMTSDDILRVRVYVKDSNASVMRILHEHLITGKQDSPSYCITMTPAQQHKVTIQRMAGFDKGYNWIKKEQ